MFIELWTKAKQNKESIFYVVLTIFLLERVRAAWNRIAAEGRSESLDQSEISRMQSVLAFKAALLYAIPFLIPVLKYVYRSIDEFSGIVEGLVFLKSTWAFLCVMLAVECFLSFIIYQLLKIYVERMNRATGFLGKLGRGMRDSSRMAIQAGGDFGTRMLTGARNTSARMLAKVASPVRRCAARAVRSPLRLMKKSS